MVGRSRKTHLSRIKNSSKETTMQRRDFLTATSAGLVSAALTPDVSQAAFTREDVGSHLNPSPDILGDLQFTDAEYERRYAKIRSSMEQQNIDCLLITGTTSWFHGEEGNLRYVVGTGVQLNPPFVVFPLTENPTFLAENASMLQRVEADLPGIISTGVPNAQEPAASFLGALAAHIRRLGVDRGRIGLGSLRVFPADLYVALQSEFPDAEFIDTDGLLTEIRLVRSDEEVRFLRRSGYCADRGIEAIVNAVAAGVTEKELLIDCDAAMARHGHEIGALNLLRAGPWNEGLGINGRIYRGSDRPVQQGDVIFTELTSYYKGYFTQLCVPISVGDPDEHFLNYLELNKDIYKAAFDAYRPGTTVAAVYAVGRELARERSNGELVSPFSCQSVDFERSFMHENRPIEPGVAYILHPWVMRADRRGYVGHNVGNTVVCTTDEPIVVHQSVQDLVIV